MMSKEEVAEIMTYCKEKGISYKSRLEELGIPAWKFFDSKSRYAKEQSESPASNGEFLQLTSGGAFQSVCLFLEGFPVGRVLHEMGYSVAILKYRVDPNAKDFAESEANCLDKANEDFARALDFLFAHQSELGVSMEDYSVWGFSAGGRTTSLWALDNSYGYAAHGLPKPAAMVLVYSGWYDPRFDGQYGTAPATFFAWLPEDDVIGEENVRGIQTYIDLLKAQNTPVETVEYHTAKHGFGEGRGTDAEGWIQLAADFWQRQQEN